MVLGLKSLKDCVKSLWDETSIRYVFSLSFFDFRVKTSKNPDVAEKFRICGAKGMGRADALPVPTNRIGGILTSRGIWGSTLFGYVL